MPQRRVPTRDEFLNYLRAQRTVGTQIQPGMTPIQSPVQRLRKLINTSPTRVIQPNRADIVNRMLSRKRSTPLW